ncbi:phosphoethanolamine transferase [Pokkaliibacter sp. CJK22405]|uniref:phosphoethanolamine transferase n=1 Tax=Pokkaliibacter sp. CJK22405 TaxID=3384615 RepID=UPI00398566F7
MAFANELRRWFRPAWRMNHHLFNALISAFMTLAYNAPFYKALWQVDAPNSVRGVLFTVNISLLVGGLTFLVLTLISLPRLNKPIAIFLFFTGAAVSYFMQTYGIVFDSSMMQNTMSTDPAEAGALFSPQLLAYLLVLGVIPTLVVLRIKPTFPRFKRELWQRPALMVGVLAVLVGLLFSMSQDYASFFRNHKEVRQKVIPMSYLYAAGAYAFKEPTGPIIAKPYGTDAKQVLTHRDKPTLTVLVVGETGRADHFGLNGYRRETTPKLAAMKDELVNFEQFTSCGTNTAVSVPCMFSAYHRDDYDTRKGLAQEGLLDVLNHAGVDVIWRDNNSGCYGACDRVGETDMRHWKDPEHCNDRECFDLVMLDKLKEALPADNKDVFIVLHQHGSHGPDYYHRYPSAFKVYTPECETNQLQNCSSEALINTYDNTMRYTDTFLAGVIDWLKQENGDYNTAMVYLADHGESLGENGIYLHGMPYMLAPIEQKHVPMFYWLSQGFTATYGINQSCMRDKTKEPFSQDNLFSTMLGMLKIQTSVYESKDDMFHGCATGS